MNTRDNYVGILLAAGHSRRFGANKLLHPLPDGRTMALASAMNLRAAIPTVLAIVQHDNTALQQLLDAHLIPWHGVASQGMGESLAAAAKATPDAAGWVVALADMPFIQPATIALVQQALQQGAALAAPTYQGQRGHPVGFSRDFGATLGALAGDDGARHLLQENAELLHQLPCNDAAILRDIDTPEDLAKKP